MGCDIHLHIEVKINNEWQHYGHPSVRRWYQLFEKMAGVRGEVCEAISPPKGFPDDATLLTRLDYVERWGADAHTPSWLSAQEISLLNDWLNEQGGLSSELDMEYHLLRTYLFGNSFAGFVKYPDDYPKFLQDVRFVFWFDC